MVHSNGRRTGRHRIDNDPAGGQDEYAHIADLYDDVALYRDRPDVPFYVDAARQPGGPVLEIGCGTGRVLVPTARAGIDIVGLDASAQMLAVCRARLSAEPAEVQARVHLIEADMRSFELDQRFALVTIPFRPFQHLLTVPDQLACLACIRRHLRAGGMLVFDVFNPSLDALVHRPIGEELAEEAEFTTADGRRVRRSHRMVALDRFNQVGQHELIYYVTHADGREERLVHAFALRYLFRFEAEHLLVRAGFDVEQVYADYRRGPYGSTYPGELVFVTRRADRS